VGIKKSKLAQIGRQKEMHDALKWLTEKDSKGHAAEVIHVVGKRFVGKTAFMKEVAYSCYQRHLFAFKIAYTDLSTIKSEQALKDMLNGLNVYESCVHRKDRNEN